MGQCSFLHLWHQRLYRAFRFGTLWPILCSYPRHSQLTRHSLMLANGRIRQSLTALVYIVLLKRSTGWAAMDDVFVYNQMINTTPYWPWHEMVKTFQTTFSKTFSWKELSAYWFKFCCTFVGKCPIDDNPTFVQQLNWCCTGAKPLP